EEELAGIGGRCSESEPVPSTQYSVPSRQEVLWPVVRTPCPVPSTQYRVLSTQEEVRPSVATQGTVPNTEYPVPSTQGVAQYSVLGTQYSEVLAGETPSPSLNLKPNASCPDSRDLSARVWEALCSSSGSDLSLASDLAVALAEQPADAGLHNGLGLI